MKLTGAEISHRFAGLEEWCERICRNGFRLRSESNQEGPRLANRLRTHNSRWFHRCGPILTVEDALSGHKYRIGSTSTAEHRILLDDATSISISTLLPFSRPLLMRMCLCIACATHIIIMESTSISQIAGSLGWSCRRLPPVPHGFLYICCLPCRVLLHVLNLR